MRRVVRVLCLLVVLGIDVPAGASGPGSLPPTRVEPAFGASFHAQMKQLFRAIKNDSAPIGATVFFPEAAYLSMKSGEIPDPSGDYVNRLIAFFDLDLAAYHRALFRGAPATLVRVDANAHFAQWIAPGVCENSIGYWHVPGVRLVVRQGNRLVSVGVFSLISWRGTWYVVHLGPNPRPADVGTVEAFRVGVGTPGPPGGC